MVDTAAMVTMAIGTGAVAVAALVGKEIAATTAKAIYAWGGAFVSMPNTLKSVGQRVDAIDKRLGENGQESVFEMLHLLHDSAEAVVIKERLRADREGVMMWHSDKSGRCLWASKSLQNTVGGTFEERFRGLAWLNLFVDVDRAEIAAEWNQSIVNNDPFIRRTKYRHEDGSAIPVRIEAFPLPGGSVLGLVTRL